MINDTNVISVDPATTITLSSFIRAGKMIPLKYDKFCFMEKLDNGVIKCIYNVLDDYYEEIEDYVIEVNFEKDDIYKYKYKPKVLAYDAYGSTDYYIFILYINKMSSVKEFNLENKKINMMRKEVFNSVFSTILSSEMQNLNIYNYKYAN